MRSRLPALLLLLTLACTAKDTVTTGGESATATGAPSDAVVVGERDAAADIRDVQSYRLSMDKVDRFLAAQKNIAVRMKAMTPADREAMRARSENDDESDNADLDAIARKIESEPLVAAAVKDAGLTPREYAVLTMAMVQSSMAASVLRMRPNDNQDSLVKAMQASTENVRFVIDNEAELTRRQQALKAEMKRLGVADID